MKKMKLLLVMFVIVVLALCGCSKEKETNSNDAVEKVPVTEEITNVENAVYVQYTDNTITIILADVEGIWYFENDMETWIDQSKVYDIVDVASHLTSEDVVDDAGALADYGLETPTYTVIVKDVDGNETTIFIGASTADGTYYATINNKEVIYIIDKQLPDSLQFNKELLKAIFEEEGEEVVEEEEDIIQEEIPDEEVVEEDVPEEEIIEEDTLESEE